MNKWKDYIIKNPYNHNANTIFQLTFIYIFIVLNLADILIYCFVFL